jgi:hypothetical protein
MKHILYNKLCEQDTAFCAKAGVVMYEGGQNVLSV